MLELGVNIDHVATIREARRTYEPDPVWAAVEAHLGGADGITVHLREDRRHIQERDVRILRQTVRGVFNLEMAATDEMLKIALEIRPDFCTLVPEKRAERTTEGGLNLGARGAASGAEGAPGAIARVVNGLRTAGIGVSLFIDPDPEVVARSHELGAGTVELHTGYYCDAPAHGPEAARQLARLEAAARASADLGLRLGAGHGLDQANVGPVAALPHLEELNIGHGLVARAVMVGMERAVMDLRAAIAEGARAAGVP
jgi:pyridoxine 5-phosphate synthase